MAKRLLEGLALSQSPTGSCSSAADSGRPMATPSPRVMACGGTMGPVPGR